MEISSRHTGLLMCNTVFKGDNLTKAHTNDAGYDIKSAETVKLLPGCSHKFKTGLHVAIPVGQEGHIRPRSGMGFKHDVVPFQGTIDSNFRGQIMVKLYNNSDTPYYVEFGDKICQMVVERCELKPFMEVDELPPADDGRGDAGFGDSGR